MVILMRMQHLNPETKETLVNRAHRERLVPRVFKYLLDLKDHKENREHLETKTLKEKPVPTEEKGDCKLWCQLQINLGESDHMLL